MKVCTNCQWQCEDNDVYCPNCGGNQFYLMQDYSDEVNQQYNYFYGENDNNQFEQNNNVESGLNLNEDNNFDYQQNNEAYQQDTYFNGNIPALKLNTSRGMIKFVLLSLITFGIYGMVTYSSISGEINIVASRYDGRRTNHFLALFFLAGVTLGIYPFVWWHGISERIGIELKRRNINYEFGAKDFWLWNVLGMLIVIGPFMYIHKLLKAMNYINENYNMYG